MYIPSYDFTFFDLPMFSPLQAQEYGASTRFSANTPLSYIDHSINQFANLLNPSSINPYIQNQYPSTLDNVPFENYFQDTPQAARERLRKLRDEANAVLGDNTPSTFPVKQQTQAKAKVCSEGYSPVTFFKYFTYCGKDLKSVDDAGIQKSDEVGAVVSPVETALNSLPQGAGIFLIAVVVIVFLLLFVKR